MSSAWSRACSSNVGAASASSSSKSQPAASRRGLGGGPYRRPAAARSRDADQQRCKASSVRNAATPQRASSLEQRAHWAVGGGGRGAGRGRSGRCEMGARDLARRVADRAARARDGDRRARDRVDVGADLERVANALAFELLRPLGQVDGEVAVGLAMIRDDDARDLAGGIHADEHLDRAVEAALERLELRRPVGEAEQLAFLLPAAAGPNAL